MAALENSERFFFFHFALIHEDLNHTFQLQIQFESRFCVVITMVLPSKPQRAQRERENKNEHK